MTRLNNARTRLLAALCLGAALAGCQDSLGPLDGGRVNVFLTDAPGDVDKVWIKIDGLTLIGEQSGELDLPGDFDEMILVSELVGRSRQIVDDAEVELDSFHQLRLLLGGVVLLAKDGKVYATEGAELPDGVSDEDVGELQCPSCAQSGWKIVLTGGDPEVEPGEDVTVVIDFDVAQSFGKQAGNSGRWVMRPVIHATRVALANAGTSSISGTVALAQGVSVPNCPAATPRSLTDYVPTATAATLEDASQNAIVRSGTTTAGGAFTIGNVAPDSYTLGDLDLTVSDLTGSWKLAFTATAAPPNVQVVQDGDNVTGVVYTVTAATCTPL
jgi:hypothetical protein